MTLEKFADMEEWYRETIDRRWTDGLPLMPPTRSAVKAAVEGSGFDGDHVVGILPPRRGIATIEQIAINSVMAGCTPQTMPIVVAAIEALLDPAFELSATQVTTNAAAPLVIVSGEIAQRLGFNDREACFAGESRSSASVGRAIRLVLRNVGGSIPGDTNKATHAHPGWFSYCIAERPGPDSWPPFHVRRGFDAESNCVTVFSCQAPFPLYVPGDADRIMRVVGNSMATPGVNMYFGGGQVLLVLAPRVADVLASAGMSPDDVARRAWETSHYRLGDLRRDQIFGSEGHTFYWGSRESAPDLSKLSDETKLPMVDSPDDIHVLVSGGDGQYWVGFCAGWGEFGGLASTRGIRELREGRLNQ